MKVMLLCRTNASAYSSDLLTISSAAENAHKKNVLDLIQ